jgi:hypothetical protein
METNATLTLPKKNWFKAQGKVFWLKLLIIPVLLIAGIIIFTACGKENAPRTSDTTALAGTYQRTDKTNGGGDQGGSEDETATFGFEFENTSDIIISKDGYWHFDQPNAEIYTVVIESNDSGSDLVHFALYFNVYRNLYGTYNKLTGEMNVKVFVLADWVDATYHKASKIIE